MKHIMGNSCKCNECYWYREPEPDEKCPEDGFCTNVRAHGINGKRLKDPKAEMPVMWGNNCSHWEDAETRFTMYEVLTLNAEPCRTPAEKEYIENLLRGDNND